MIIDVFLMEEYDDDSTMYAVATKIIDPELTSGSIQTPLQGYRELVTRGGHLDYCTFSREEIPRIGEMVIFRSLKEDAAKKVYEVWSGMEGLITMPIHEGTWGEDKARVEEIREELANSI